MERIATWEAFDAGPTDPAAEFPPHEYRCVMAYLEGKAEKQAAEAAEMKRKSGRRGPGRYPRRY